MKVTWTEEEIEHVMRVPREIADRADTYADRFASPHERHDVGRHLNPSTAWVFFIYGEVLDPYGDLDLQPEESCIGRLWFAVDPVERIAISFYDLPEAKRSLLGPKWREADTDGWRRLLTWGTSELRSALQKGSRIGAVRIGPDLVSQGTRDPPKAHRVGARPRSRAV
jgi:hypothetical protein